MALINWSSRYSVGVAALDNQHKALIDVLNEFHAACMRGSAQKVAGPLIHRLESLASQHFATEEKLMESAKYSGLAEHRERHRELSAKVAEFVSSHKKGDATIYVPLLVFMRDWLNNHMQTEDRKYAPWLNEDVMQG
jgi:hemerythrin-like metal-binding protein